MTSTATSAAVSDDALWEEPEDADEGAAEPAESPGPHKIEWLARVLFWGLRSRRWSA